MTRRKKVTVWFVGTWDGYRPAQQHIVQTTKRRLYEEDYEKLPKSFTSSFSDNTRNSWVLQLEKPSELVSGGYDLQVDNFLDEHKVMARR